MSYRRRKLPDRRHSWTQRVKINGQTFYATFGQYPDGTLGEIFLEAQLEGTFLRGVLGSLARVTSIALQCGSPIEDVVHALRGLNFPPNGEVVGEYTKVTSCTSIADWLAQEIELAYGERKSV